MPQDLASFRDLALADERVATMLAHVAVHEGETQHWFVTAEGHVAITVNTHHHGVPVTAILPTGSGAARGMWAIPDVGTEVAIGFNNGDFEGDAYVLAIYGHTSPVDLQPARLLIVGEEVWAYDGNGPAVALALKSDVDSLANYVQNDLTLPVSGATAGPTASPTVPSAAGTQILKAK